MQRSLEELIERNDPAWPNLEKFFDTAKNAIEVLPVERNQASTVLHNLQVTTGSSLSAVAYETGGLLIDNGSIRLLGSGHPRLSRNPWDWNEAGNRLPGAMLVADDAVGVFFAVNGGALAAPQGNVFYLRPIRCSGRISAADSQTSSRSSRSDHLKSSMKAQVGPAGMQK